MYVVLAAGGTGGHTIPANRLAKQLECRGVKVCIKATRGFGTKYRALTIDPLKMLCSFIKERPSLVIGFGSYHSFAPLLAATLLRIPIVLVELNAVPGRVNRLFARIARWTGANIPFKGARHVQMPFPAKGKQMRSRLLVMGGSHGARSLDEAIAKLDFTDLEITHLHSKNFVSDMQPIWESTDIAITRAGGMTIAELLHYQVPAVLVPYPYATDDHQRKNAEYVESLGAGILSCGDLQKELEMLLKNKESMRKSIDAPGLIDLVMQELIPSTHFLGIGGCGMSALAHILLDRGALVSGSDQKTSSVTELLAKRGAIISKEHSASRIVRSTAISLNHPELRSPHMHRSKLLQEQMQGKKAILVAGTHGKTTTSALLSWTLHVAGLHPCYAVGGHMPNFDRNGGYNSGDFFVAEADESDGSFLHLSPHHAILTNVEPEHLDYYGSEKKMYRAFEKFIDKVEGTLVWCSDDPYLKELSPPGISYSSNEGFMKQNAEGVRALCTMLGIDDRDIREAEATFLGVKRRSEFIGTKDGITIYDDYAHHPTEVLATLKLLKQKTKKLIVVFQPHRYTRTEYHLSDFATAFGAADELILTDIYGAGEAPIDGLHAISLLELLNVKRARYIPRHKLTSFLKTHLCEGDTLLTMGAGDVTSVGPELIS